MASENYAPRFDVSLAFLGRLAQEVMPDLVAAVAELVKNSIDAEATKVYLEVSTDAGTLVISDNGRGMRHEDILEKWLVLGNTEESSGAPLKLGGQGFGKLATLRLGRHVQLTTRSPERATIIVTFDWDSPGVKLLSELDVNVSTNKDEGFEWGTEIRITNLQDSWGQVKPEEWIPRLETRVFSLLSGKAFLMEISINGARYVLGPKKPHQPSTTISLETVWMKKSVRLQSALIEFYERYQLLRQGISAAERASQAVMVVRNANEEIVGVATVDQVRVKQLNDAIFFVYRCVVLPDYRRPGLDSKLLVETRNELETFSKTMTENRPVGIMTFVENPRIQKVRNEAVWKASGMAFMGYDKKGRQIRVYYFRGAQI